MSDRIELNVSDIGIGSLKLNGIDIAAQSVDIHVRAGRPTKVIITMPPSVAAFRGDTDRLIIPGWTRDEPIIDQINDRVPEEESSER